MLGATDTAINKMWFLHRAEVMDKPKPWTNIPAKAQTDCRSGKVEVVVLHLNVALTKQGGQPSPAVR